MSLRSSSPRLLNPSRGGDYITTKAKDLAHKNASIQGLHLAALNIPLHVCQCPYLLCFLTRCKRGEESSTQVNEHADPRPRDNQTQSIHPQGMSSKTTAGRKSAGGTHRLRHPFLSPARKGKRGYSLQSCDHTQAAGNAWPRKALHGAGFGVGGGLLAARTSCLLSEGHYKSKAAFCRLSTALPFSTKPVNKSPAA